MVRATLNEPVPLQVLAADGRTDLFGRALIKRPDGTTLTTINLSHLGDGVYGSTHTYVQEGYFSVIYSLFLDAGRTIPATYDLESELMEVSSDKTNLLRLLGLLHENSIFDQQVYDAGNKLTSGRLRVFKTKADALAETVSGLLFTYTISATYTGGGLLSKYLITRDT